MPGEPQDTPKLLLPPIFTSTYNLYLPSSNGPLSSNQHQPHMPIFLLVFVLNDASVMSGSDSESTSCPLHFESSLHFAHSQIADCDCDCIFILLLLVSQLPSSIEVHIHRQMEAGSTHCAWATHTWLSECYTPSPITITENVRYNRSTNAPPSTKPKAQDMFRIVS